MSVLRETAPPAASGTPEAATIRPAGLADLDALLALENAAFSGDRATRRAIRHAILSPSMSLLVAVARTIDREGADVLLGAATLERRSTSRTARLSSIAVSPTRAGSGLGGLLLDAAEAEASRHGCTRLRLEVRTDNGAGIRLYERRGYLRTATREAYYEDGMAAWCYAKTLDGAA